LEYRNLTGTGLRVSRLCLGTVPFGLQLDEKDSLSILDYSLEHGINFIDTANTYGNSQAECILAKGLKGRRDQVIIGTKVCEPAGPGINDRGLSRRHILQQVECSLRKLDTDYIDIYWMHQPDYDTPIEETLDTFSKLVRDGKIRYVGMCNFAAWQVCEALWKSDRFGFAAPSVTQVMYNLLARGIEDEFLLFARQYKTGVVIYNPVAAGLLTGRYRTADDSIAENSRFDKHAIHKNRYWNAENFDAVDKLTKIAEASGITLLELTVRWCISIDIVDSVLIGSSKIQQMEQNIEAAEKGPLSADIMAACDGVWTALKGNRPKYNR